MKALKGIRVLDLSRFQSGPVCGMLLGDMGAEVIRIEEPGGAGDRSWGLLGPDSETLSYKIVGRNKKGITLNLGTVAGKKIFRKLVAVSDVVLHNFSPGAPQAEQLAYTRLRRANRRVIVAAISGFGQNGPDAELPCFDGVAQARSGGMVLTGFPGDPPLKSTITHNDITSGLFAALGIVIALYDREKAGVGQFIDVSLFDTAFFCTQAMGALLLYEVYGEVRQQVGNLGFHSYIGIFKTKDERWVLISGTTNAIWKRLTKAIGRTDMGTDPLFSVNDMIRFDNGALIDPIVDEWVGQRTADEVIDVLRQARVPCSIVNTVDQVVNDPQVAARRMIRYVDYPGVGRIPLPGLPLNLSGMPERAFSLAPKVGEHNDVVYRELLGLNGQHLERLKSKGVI